MLTLPGRVFSMAQSGSRLVVATSGRHVLIYDLRMCTPQPLAEPFSGSLPLCNCVSPASFVLMLKPCCRGLYAAHKGMSSFQHF